MRSLADGDGSLCMNLGELKTMTTNGLPVKVIVLNNAGDGMVKQWQKLYFGQRFAASDRRLRRKNFVRAAEADGFAWARRLTNKAALEATIAEFLGYRGPAFLEVVIDPDACVYPMVRPGASYAEMLTGPHIKARGVQAAQAGGVATTAMF